MLHITAIVGAFLLWHIAARALWVWNPLGSSQRHDRTGLGYYADLNPAIGEICDPRYPGYYCELIQPDRTLLNYNTDIEGIIATHIGGAFLLIVGVCAAILLGWIMHVLYMWVFYEKMENEEPADEQDEEPYVSECSDPSCRCKEHVVNDVFVYGNVNRWVEKSESTEPVKIS